MSEGYLNPIEIIRRGYHIGHITEKKPSIENNFALASIAYRINGKTAIAPLIESDILYRELYRQHLNGENYLRIELYKLPRNELQHCQDIGDVFITKIEKAQQKTIKQESGLVSINIPSSLLDKLKSDSISE